MSDPASRKQRGAARLVILDGPRQGTAFPLVMQETLVGRIDSAQFVIDDATVSRLHARLLLGEDAVTVEDLDSREGTWVNGAAVKGPMRLNDGDQVAFGDVVVSFHRDEA